MTDGEQEEVLCFFRYHWGDRVKPVLPRRVECLASDELKYDTWCSIEAAGVERNVLVSMSVLGKLVRYMAYRPRTTATPLLLQTKAGQVTKELGLNDVQASVVISASVAVAMLVSEPDQAGWWILKQAWFGITRWTDVFRRGLLEDNRWLNRAIKGMAYLLGVGGALFGALQVIPGAVIGFWWLLHLIAIGLGMLPLGAWLMLLGAACCLCLLASRPRDVVTLSPV